jgi:hypothetical protein
VSSPNPHAIDADTLSGMKPLRKVVYSIGSNLGDRLGNVQGAVDALRDTPDVIVVDVSSVYETKPLGGPYVSLERWWRGHLRSRTPSAGLAMGGDGHRVP